MSTFEHDKQRIRGRARLYWILIIIAVICWPTMCLAQSSAYEHILSYNNVWLILKVTNSAPFSWDCPILLKVPSLRNLPSSGQTKVVGHSINIMVSSYRCGN